MTKVWSSDDDNDNKNLYSTFSHGVSGALKRRRIVSNMQTRVPYEIGPK